MMYTNSDIIEKAEKKDYHIKDADKSNIIENLYNVLKKGEWAMKRRQDLIRILDNNSDEKLREYYKRVYDVVYADKNLNNLEVKEGMEMFQTAFLEMEGLAKTKKRDQPGKTLFDHLLGVLDNILDTENPTINQCIIAILHDSVEEIPGYTLGHIAKTYNQDIANNVNNLTKKYNREDIANNAKKDLTSLLSIGLKNNNINIKNATSHEIKKIIDEEIRKKAKIDYDNNRHIYYNGMLNRQYDGLKVKFADRKDALQTMAGIRQSKLIKKLCETRKYFLIDEFKTKRNIEGYQELKIRYDRLLLNLKNKNIDAYQQVLNSSNGK